jgi:membrane protease YdiL (CAAX protease family)
MERTACPSSSVAPFFGLAFLFTYALQLPAVAARLGWLDASVESLLPLAMLGVFGPMVAAVLVTRAEGGWPGVRRLFASLGPGKLRLRDALVALLLPALLLSLLLLLLRYAGREGPVVYTPEPARLVVGAVIAIAEEIGWRGIAQPRLERRYGAFGSAGVVGVVWTLWHIPMFVGAGVSLDWLLVMTLFFVGGSLMFGWLVRRSGGALIAVLAHFGAHLNNSHLALPQDGLPLVVHAIVFAGIGLAVTPFSLVAPLRGVRGLRSGNRV